MIDRRAFLRAAGLAGAGTVLAGCSSGTNSGPAVPGPTTMQPPSTSTSAEAIPPNWDSFRARISGGVVLPGEQDFQAAHQVFNTLWDARKPAAVARCENTEDVQACVKLAVESKVPIAARSGGHSYAGYSVPENGLLVDVSALAAVEVRPDGTVRVGAGAKLMDVYTALAKAGRCLPAGSCPTVGIAGLTLGGGIGVLSRKFGLTCDRLEAATLVTADNQLVTASRGRQADLFWALRGGGGGNFGIVTEFVFVTEPAPELTVFSLRFPAGSVPQVLGSWQEWIAAAPPELWSNLVITGGRTPSCTVGGCFVGPAGALNSLLAGLQERPTSRLVQSKGYLDAMKYFAGSSNRQTFVASSRMLEKAADPAKVTELMAGRTDMDMLLDSLGGAVATVDPAASAYPWRKALASAQIYQKTDVSAAARATSQVNEVRDGLGAITGQNGYVNYIDPAMPDWANAYYGSNLPRLREIARIYDPDKVFAFPQGIPQKA
jgi:FAD/FMN-containing dehydrogenase